MKRTQQELDLARARDLGTDHGTQAAEQVVITGIEHARMLLNLTDNGDETQMAEYLPDVPGHQRDRASVHTELGVPDDGKAGGIYTAYVRAFDDALVLTLGRRARLAITPSPRLVHQGYHKVRITLTATSNPTLADRLPVDGELEVFEMNSDGHVQPHSTVFRAAEPDGTLAAPVEVRDIAYTYRYPTTATSPASEIDKGVEDLYHDFRAARAENDALLRDLRDARTDVHDTDEHNKIAATLGDRRKEVSFRLLEIATQLDDLARAGHLPNAWRTPPHRKGPTT